MYLLDIIENNFYKYITCTKQQLLSNHRPGLLYYVLDTGETIMFTCDNNMISINDITINYNYGIDLMINEEPIKGLRKMIYNKFHIMQFECPKCHSHRYKKYKGYIEGTTNIKCKQCGIIYNCNL